MHLKSFLIFILIFFCFSENQKSFHISILFAQKLPLRHLSLDIGLIHNHINKIQQDPFGYLWLATDGGISRFDGKNIKNFTPQNSELGASMIQTITFDRKGRLWAGYNGGVAELKDQKFVNYPINDNGMTRNVLQLWPDPNEGVWIVFEQGLSFFNQGQVTDQLMSNINGVQSHSRITGNGQNTIYIGTQQGMYQKTGNDNFELLNDIKFSVISLSYSLSSGWLYLTNGTSLFRWKNSVLEKVADSPLPDPIHFLSIGNNDKIILNSANGIWIWQKNQEKVFTSEELGLESISSTLEDNEGKIWLSSQKGVSQLLHFEIRNFDHFFNRQTVTAIAKDNKDQLWISGSRQVICIDADGKIIKSLPTPRVESLLIEKDQIWIGTEKGLWNFTLEGKFLQVLEKELSVTVLSKDKKGAIWVGTRSGLYKVENSKLKLIIDGHSGLSSNVIKMIAEDSLGDLWVGTENGLSLYNERQWQHFSTAHGLSSNSILAFVEHPVWGILFGTSRGINQWKMGTFQILPILTNSIVQALLVDDTKRLWVGTTEGVWRYGYPQNYEIQINQNSGLIDNGIYQQALSIYKENLYVGTYQGLSRLSLNIKEAEHQPPLLQIESIDVNETPIPFSNLSQALPHDYQQLKISFNAIDISTSDPISYSYKLFGFDDNWSNRSNRNSVIYNGLPAGSYTFAVQSFNKQDKRSTIQKISFSIEQPFWQKTWFIFSITLLLLTLVLIFNQWYLSRLYNKQKSLNQLNQELEEKRINLDKFKDDFLMNITHELSTPLFGIISLAEGLLIANTEALPQTLSKDIHFIMQSARGLIKIINDIQDYIKLKHRQLDLNYKVVDIELVIQYIIHLCQELATEKNIVIGFRFDTPLRKVWADEFRLQQILFNLLNNAIKFTENGAINFLITSNDHQLLCSIKDTGIGIPDENIPLIFQPFEQIKGSNFENFTNIGLGLAITKHLIELHGGSLDCLSQQNLGTTMTFCLQIPSLQFEGQSTSFSPLLTMSINDYREIYDEDRENESTEANQHTELGTILIVDDEVINLKIVRQILQKRGYGVLIAEDGEAAWNFIQIQKPDLVLLDLMMPKMNGFELLKLARQHFDLRSLPILILSPKDRIEDMLHAVECGANDYITTPIQREMLLARVETHLYLKEGAEAKKNVEELKYQLIQLQTSPPHPITLYSAGRINVSPLSNTNISQEEVEIIHISGIGDVPKMEYFIALVSVMRLSMELWHNQTGRNKIEFAEESKLWSAYLDKSNFVSRTLDKYLDIHKLPKNPRWRTVVQSGYYVLKACPNPEPQRELLIASLNNLQKLLNLKYM